MNNKPRVLIIDDDKDDQYFLLEALKELYPSLQCSAVNNGKEALEFIEQNPPPPAYIFLDLNMPFLNGFEFLREFKKDKANNETTIYIYSTSSHPTDKEISKNLGASDYITKMSDLTKLKSKLKTAISLS
jgi:CheY-like chemotaxis protein